MGGKTDRANVVFFAMLKELGSAVGIKYQCPWFARRSRKQCKHIRYQLRPNLPFAYPNNVRTLQQMLGCGWKRVAQCFPTLYGCGRTKPEGWRNSLWLIKHRVIIATFHDADGSTAHSTSAPGQEAQFRTTSQKVISS